MPGNVLKSPVVFGLSSQNRVEPLLLSWMMLQNELCGSTLLDRIVPLITTPLLKPQVINSEDSSSDIPLYECLACSATSYWVAVKNLIATGRPNGISDEK